MTRFHTSTCPSTVALPRRSGGRSQRWRAAECFLPHTSDPATAFAFHTVPTVRVLDTRPATQVGTRSTPARSRWHDGPGHPRSPGRRHRRQPQRHSCRWHRGIVPDALPNGRRSPDCFDGQLGFSRRGGQQRDRGRPPRSLGDDLQPEGHRQRGDRPARLLRPESCRRRRRWPSRSSRACWFVCLLVRQQHVSGDRDCGRPGHFDLQGPTLGITTDTLDDAFTVPTDGDYKVSFGVVADAANQLNVEVNGLDPVGGSMVFGSLAPGANGGSTTLTLAAGDTITLVNRTSATDINFSSPRSAAVVRRPMRGSRSSS